MKIAITWSNWFVWSYLVDFFWKDNKVYAFNRKMKKLEWNIEYIKWDLNYKFQDDIDFDIFIHCASDTWYEKSKKEMIRNNVEINKNVIDLVNKSNCKHFLYISSSSVYQWLSGEIKANIKINKNNLKNSYSLTKFLAEEYIKENIRNDIRLTILRPRAIYWKWDRVLIPNILKNQILWRLILPWNWKQVTSLTEINFFIDKINKFIENRKYWVYNISSEVNNYEDLYKQIVREYNLKWIIKVPMFIFRILSIFNNNNKYSYIVDTFWNDKVLVNE